MWKLVSCSQLVEIMPELQRASDNIRQADWWASGEEHKPGFQRMISLLDEIQTNQLYNHWTAQVEQKQSAAGVPCALTHMTQAQCSHCLYNDVHYICSLGNEQ